MATLKNRLHLDLAIATQSRRHRDPHSGHRVRPALSGRFATHARDGGWRLLLDPGVPRSEAFTAPWAVKASSSSPRWLVR